MKEATGEANMTVVTVILIGVVLTLAAVFLPTFFNGLKYNACCVEAGGKVQNGQCTVNVSTSCTG